jgi:RHS repeat-associated protein
MKLKLMIRLLLLAGLLSGFAPVAQAFYNPSAGRWLSRDPLGEIRRIKSSIGWAVHDPNLYAFVHNDSPNRVDPDGRAWQTSIELCNRKIENPCNDAIIGCANGVGHNFYRWPDGSGRYGAIGFQDPSGKDGDLPKADHPEQARKCRTCTPLSNKLKYGKGKDKDGYDATEEEILECLKQRPIKGDYGGISNNCNDWASGAAKDCGIGCNNPWYLVKQSKGSK